MAARSIGGSSRGKMSRLSFYRFLFSNRRYSAIVNNIIYSLSSFIAPRHADRLRPMFSSVIDKRNLVGTEIGVSVGGNALVMLTHLHLKTLYLIDPYIPYTQTGGQTKFLEMHPTVEQEAHERLKHFSDRTVWIKNTSESAASEVPDNLDFVYIDGNHDYDFVKKDIETYYAKVKRGGIFGGHDFDPEYPGVFKAVVEFAHSNNLKLRTKECDWFVVKR
jgi:hypothetical protein